MATDSIKYLAEQIISYRDDRDWKQYHTAKNCAANISVEAGELLDFYRWQEHASSKDAAAEEAADIFYSLVLYCDAEGIDLGKAVINKLEKNAAKYPVDKFKGSAKKYDEL